MTPSRITLSIVFLQILSSSLIFGQGWTDDGTVVRLTTSTDNVGIGTAAPTTKLDVAGTVTATLFHTGINNSLFGNLAGSAITTGVNNAFFGQSAGISNTTGSFNSFFGRFTGYSNTAGYENSFFGEGVGYANTTGYENSFFGQATGNSNTTGYWNSFFGDDAGHSNTTGNRNSFFGQAAGSATTTGYENSFFGQGAGFSNTTGYFNAFFGGDAGQFNTIGQSNSFFGRHAGNHNTTASQNSFFGTYAGDFTTSGGSNCFFGFQAGRSNTTGISNSFFGVFAGNANTTGTNRTGVGYFANSAGTAYNNTTGLGYNANCTAANQVRIGNTSVRSIGGYVNWTNLSDSRFKRNVQEDVKGLEFITGLRPVSYNLDLQGVNDFFARHSGERPTESQADQREKESIRYSGFIAQEVEATARALGYDFSGVDAPKNADDFYGLRYSEFVVPLVKAVQEQQEMIQDQQATIGLLIATLEKNGIDVGILKDKGKETPKGESRNSGSEIIGNPASSIDGGTLPADFGISNNYPNPFNPSTTIEYALPAAGQVTIKVYNSLGQEVRTLVDDFQEAGYKSVVWDGKNHAGSPVATGTYVYRVTSGNSVKTEKMVLAK